MSQNNKEENIEDFKVDDILLCRFGYLEKSFAFYRVLKVSPSFVTVIRIMFNFVGDEDDKDVAVPDPTITAEEHGFKPERRKPRKDSKGRSYIWLAKGSAHKWNGKPVVPE